MCSPNHIVFLSHLDDSGLFEDKDSVGKDGVKSVVLRTSAVADT